jgi:signal peptidase I
MDFPAHTVEATQAAACQLAAEVAGQFGGVRLRVSGTSMTPAVRPGDVLAVEKASFSQVDTGEIVVFARDGRLVAHRLVAKTECHLITRGDRTRRNDSPVSVAEFVGRVTDVERGGTPVQARKRPSIAQQAIARVLRFSDRATYLYLRLAAL